MMGPMETAPRGAEGSEGERTGSAGVRRGASRRARLVLLVVAVLLPLGACELALRVLWVAPSSRSTVNLGAHGYYGWAPLPGIEGGVVRTREFEHRVTHSVQRLRGDRVFEERRPEGVRARVLFLGDSFTYGAGSGEGEHFVDRLARAWPDVEVANSGANGYGTREELAVLDYLGESFRPDLVVLCFFWNDLEDNLRPSSPAFAEGPGGGVVRTDGVERPTASALERLAPTALERAPQPWFVLPEFVTDATKKARYRYLGMRARKIRTEAERQAAWVTTRTYLGLVARRAKQLGAKLAVVALPDHNQVNPTAVIRNVGPINYEVQEPLREACEGLGVPVVDPLEAMREAYAREGRDLYYYEDRHLTPEGNRVLAEAIAPALGTMLPGRR